MLISHCRVCGSDFFPEPLLHFDQMPKAAQNFPDKDTLSQDEGVTLDVFQCQGCGLVQLNNEPLSYYREVIRASAFSEEMKTYRMAQFSDLIEKWGLKGKKLIEVGCGKGEYLSIFNALDVNTFGLEYAPDSVRVCQEASLNVKEGFMEQGDYSIEQGPFDAAVILSFFEHVPEPNTVLAGDTSQFDRRWNCGD